MSMLEITPERLAQIETRCKAATKPPWRFSAPGGMDCIWMDVVDENGDEILSGETQPQPHICQNPEAVTASFEQVKADLEFAAHARTDIPDLLAAIKQLQEERDQFAAALMVANDALTEISETTHERRLVPIAEKARELMADPATRLKERDAEIRATVLKQVAAYLQAKTHRRWLDVENDRVAGSRDGGR